MAKLTALSGVGGKLPAAFLLEVADRRILFDLGEGPQAGVFPDLTGVGRVDAICLSHAHMDHAGGLHLAAEIGDPPVYATETTLQQLPFDVLPVMRRRALPMRGDAVVAGLPITLGRSGHAPGGIWFHVPLDGGFLYMGDWSAESALLPFDAPPPADCVVTDASYGDREAALPEQVEALAEAAKGGMVLPVPSGGRGPEMVLVLAQRGLKPKACPTIRAEMERLAAEQGDGMTAEDRAGLRSVLKELPMSDDYRPSDIIVAVEANAEAGLSADLLAGGEGFRFLFSSHVPVGTPAAALLAEGRAQWLPWNVHPRLSDTLGLTETTGARYVIPAFARPEDMPELCRALGSRLVLDRTVVFGQTERLQGTGT
ncbi:MBL fold metallo-hydrolase [Oryzicola mucosus]|uniref:MBL fold metallo-hydrolase n=1 Tax=Oryzicola mucosus TaxID=2767425 RepID=A0A8J6Q3A6_9HYPH|nr:MBL fold metallo-hydrolase [Oryzicola mucosus]